MELAAEGRIVSDSLEFFKAFTKNVTTTFATQCATQLFQKTSTSTALESLRVIAADADARNAREEKEMHAPLLKIFSAIAEYQSTSTQLRKFVDESGPLRSAHDNSPGFPQILPDMTIADVDIAEDESKRNQIENLTAFVKLKPSSKHDGPKPKVARITAKLILVQSASYARMFSAARPFRIFSIGLMIWGTCFCLGYFDRGGVVLTPAMNYYEYDGMCNFVKVIRSITHFLDDTAFGLDPTVERRRRQDIASAAFGTDYIYIIRPKDRSGPNLHHTEESYVTDGEMIWTGLSLFGRGTQVFIVRKLVNGVVQQQSYILKNAWRSANRASESYIYGALEAGPDLGQNTPKWELPKDIVKGIGHLVSGSDVDLEGRPLSVNVLRAIYNIPEAPEKFDAVLHRMLFDRMGRYLWEFESPLDILEALKSIVLALKALAGLNVVHRDVSPFNVLLEKDPDSNLGNGFINDFESALLPPQFTKSSTTTCAIPGSSSSRTYTKFDQNKRGDPITGTLHFLPLEVLEAIRDRRPVKPSPYHDLESLCWVIGYTFMRRLLAAAKDLPQNSGNDAILNELKTTAKLHYGHLTIAALTLDRANVGPFNFLTVRNNKFAGRVLGHSLVTVASKLFTKFNTRLLYVYDLTLFNASAPDSAHGPALPESDPEPKSDTPPTPFFRIEHDWLLSILDEGIAAETKVMTNKARS